MRAPLQWMVPVALVAAVLAPVAAALPGLDSFALPDGLLPVAPDAASLSSLPNRARDNVFEPVADEPIQHDPDDEPTAPSGQQRRGQDGVLGQARNTAGTAQEQAAAQGRAARELAEAEVRAQRGEAEQRAQQLQQDADGILAMLPDDPVGFAAATAQGAAGQAAQRIPRVFADPTVEPQGGSQQVVAPDNSLIPPILAGSLLVAGAAGATFIAFWLAGSSGTVATGAAAAKGSELRRLLPFASPLFTRFEKETVLGHPRREALYALILQQPGISLQSLGESTGLSRTAVLHHLRLLEMQHLIVSKRMGRSRHYYENGGRYGRDAKEAYAILQNPRSKEVAEYIRTHPGAMQKQLCEALAIQPSIAHWHVRRLQAAQLVECVRQGRAVNYFPGRSLLEVAAQVPIPAQADLPEMPPAPAPLASTPLGA